MFYIDQENRSKLQRYDVQALVMKPSDFDKSKKYPLAFLIHGGPQGAWNDNWSTRWNPAIFAEQGYVVVRERTHRNTAESTNARVKWWSIFQLGVVIGEGVFQVWWLKRFFEVKSGAAPSFGKGALG